MKNAIALLVFVATSLAIQGAFVANGPSNQGTDVSAYFPPDQHIRNTGGLGVLGPGTGAGLCVFTAIEQAARYQNIHELDGLQEWMKRKPGGGWPEKVDDVLREFCAEKGVPVPPYIQHTGGDMEVIRLALKTGRYPCTTYSGRDGVYYRAPIAHMVNSAHLSSDKAAIQDNNYPGRWLWMTPEEFKSRWSGWVIVFLGPPPPPVPVN